MKTKRCFIKASLSCSFSKWSTKIYYEALNNFRKLLYLELNFFVVQGNMQIKKLVQCANKALERNFIN